MILKKLAVGKYRYIMGKRVRIIQVFNKNWRDNMLVDDIYGFNN